MKYFCVEPEVAGEIGKNSIVDWKPHPPIVERLHYEFNTWLGDALLDTFPCLIVTAEAAQALKAASATGVEFDEVEISTTEDFRERHLGQKLPPFLWLRIKGEVAKDDFGIYRDTRGERPIYRYVVSERALDAIRPFGLNYADIEPFQ